MQHNKKHHMPDGSFRNNYDIKMTHRSFLDVVKWKVFERRPEKESISVIHNDYSIFSSSNQSLVSWIGHATFLIRHLCVNIITDPHFSDRASPVQWAGPKRFSPAAVNIQNLPNIDIVVISHDHYDHLDKYSVQAIQKKQMNNPPLFILPLGLGKWFTNKGITNWVELDWWQSYKYQGWVYTAVPAQHFSGRFIRQDRTLWCGWVFEAPDRNKFYFAGDTGYSQDFKEIGQRFGGFDFSMIPIGAYEPQWFMKYIHANPEEAVFIHKDVKSKFSVAMHWGSFMLTNESMLQPLEDLKVARHKHGISESQFTVMGQGEIQKIPLADQE